MSKHKVNLIKEQLIQNKISAYLVPEADQFLSEYVPLHEKRLKYLTSFNGSNGFAIITLEEKSVFFTDGRYILQASKEVERDVFDIYNLKDKKITDWILERKISGKIGFDPKLHSLRQIREFKKAGIDLIAIEENLVDKIWADKPVEHPTNPFLYSEEYSGKNFEEKLLEVKANIPLLITAPESVCWLLNIRGDDIPYTPFLNSIALINKEVIHFFARDKNASKILPAKVLVHELSNLENILQELKITEIQYDEDDSTYFYHDLFQKMQIEVINKVDPCSMPKAMKNKIELENIRKAHIQDGVALSSMLHFIDKSRNSYLDELLIDQKLIEFRKMQPKFYYPSFPTIAGFAENGAIIHYRADEKSNKEIKGNNLLLIDSGGQYLLGTTDVTRTVAIGNVSAEQKLHFTLVLKGNIAVSNCIFPKGTTGSMLDILARKPLWEYGLDYDHGTGHGVGCFLSVHEGPQRISKGRNDPMLVPGMILSVEPGYYLENQYGIRIENLVEVVEHKGMLKFSTLTLAPIDKRLIDKGLLEKAEIMWLNNYHKMVREKLAIYISDQDMLLWLQDATAEI